MTHATTPRILSRPSPSEPIFHVTGEATIALRAGTVLHLADGLEITFDADTAIDLLDDTLDPGADFFVRLDGDKPIAFRPIAPDAAGIIGGFHFAPGGNAPARAGGADVPAINPRSCWDAGFRPTCLDPRGMALVEQNGLAFWCDIYLLGVDHARDGTSRHGAEIADGDSLSGGLDFATARSIYAGHGKQLLTYDEFRAAAFGVTERSSADDDPDTTGLDPARTSRFGIMQATGNLWVWGTDGDPDDPRASLFGGSWLDGRYAGSRYANLDNWPEDSSGSISARGRSDHLTPA